MRVIGRLFKLVLLLALIAAGAVGFYGYLPYGPSQETFVDIAPGTGTEAMAAQLEKAGVIRSRYAFEAMKAVAWRSAEGGGVSV